MLPNMKIALLKWPDLLNKKSVWNGKNPLLFFQSGHSIEVSRCVMIFIYILPESSTWYYDSFQFQYFFWDPSRTKKWYYQSITWYHRRIFMARGQKSKDERRRRKSRGPGCVLKFLRVCVAFRIPPLTFVKFRQWINFRSDVVLWNTFCFFKERIWIRVWIW